GFSTFSPARIKSRRRRSPDPGMTSLLALAVTGFNWQSGQVICRERFAVGHFVFALPEARDVTGDSGYNFSGSTETHSTSNQRLAVFSHATFHRNHHDRTQNHTERRRSHAHYLPFHGPRQRRQRPHRRGA